MTFSFRIHRERGAFELSAICCGGIVPVGACGCLHPLLETETQPKSLNKVHASTPFEPLPILPPAGPLAASLRHILQLRLRPFSSVVVIGNTLRRLASVLLLRLSQSPRISRDEEPRLNLKSLGAFLKAPRSLTRPRFQLCQKSPRGPLDTFCLSFLSTAVVHEKKSNNGVLKCLTKEFPKTEKEFPRIP